MYSLHNHYDLLFYKSNCWYDKKNASHYYNIRFTNEKLQCKNSFVLVAYVLRSLYGFLASIALEWSQLIAITFSQAQLGFAIYLNDWPQSLNTSCRIHLVANHFSPASTLHPPCKVLWSVEPSDLCKTSSPINRFWSWASFKNKLLTESRLPLESLLGLSRGNRDCILRKFT